METDLFTQWNSLLRNKKESSLCRLNIYAHFCTILRFQDNCEAKVIERRNRLDFSHMLEDCGRYRVQNILSPFFFKRLNEVFKKRGSNLLLGPLVNLLELLGMDGGTVKNGQLININILFILYPITFSDFFLFFYVLYFNTASKTAALRFHCVGGCWDRTLDCCDFGIGSQTL